jgi:hypothetical protein
MSILGKIKNIYTGWKNYLTDDEIASDLAKERSKHCATCPNAVFEKHLLNVKDDVKIIEGFICNLCHCPLSAKLRVPEEKCDDGKW